MLRRALVEEQLTRSVIGAFYEVYNTLGFGFLEHIYKAALEFDLLARGHHVAREVQVVVLYKGKTLAVQRIDMIVDGKLVVETKSTAELPAGSQRQLHDYCEHLCSRWVFSCTSDSKHDSIEWLSCTREEP